MFFNNKPVWQGDERSISLYEHRYEIRYPMLSISMRREYHERIRKVQATIFYATRSDF